MATLEEMIAAVNLVREDGLSLRQAGRARGVSHETVRRWRRVLEGDAPALYGIVGAGTTTGRSAVDLDDLPDDPDELKRIIFDMRFELDLREAVADILKKDPGVDPRALPNREKALLVDALATKGTYSTGWILSCVALAPATFYYHRKRMGADPDAELRARVVEACAAHPEFGYRRVRHALREEGGRFAHASEKRIRRIMKREGLQPPRRRRNSRYSSYDARKDKGEALPNVPLGEDGRHDFSAPAPNELWVSDVTEFLLPGGERVFLSPVLDCFDSSLVSWQISDSEKADDLTNPSLLRSAEKLGEGHRCCIHTDRGGQYFSEGWVGICSRHGLARSMSRKGRSPDNARMEGFFGRLKMEFFDTRDWRGVSAEEFASELDAWLVYYNEARAKESLGWMSPMGYRRLHLKAA